MDDPTAGTAFLGIHHSIIAVGHGAFFRSPSTLAGASVSTPVGVLSGGLSVRASGGLRTGPGQTCRGHPYLNFNRSARITAGQITARFDSIGTYIFGRNLKAVGMTGYRRLS